jgi:hypothetical protein
MAVFACTNCGWVRRSSLPVDKADCPLCGRPARALTTAGSLPGGRARSAAITARALHDPAVMPAGARDRPRR